eukprot:COSAG03_NODE_15021_length_443_cov_3.110465_1_plen_67_part_01
MVVFGCLFLSARQPPAPSRWPVARALTFEVVHRARCEFKPRSNAHTLHYASHRVLCVIRATSHAPQE